MKAFVISVVLGLAMISPSFAWAILLSKPELFPVWRENTETVKEVKAAMKKMDFKGGIVHVTAPEPRRILRFGDPGQSVNELLPLLKKVGFEVSVSFSETLNKEWGFVMAQKEDGSKELVITINSKHAEFDRELLKL